MKLQELSERYLDELQVQRNLSVNTTESYSQDLRALLRALGEAGITDVEGVTEDALRGYLAGMARANRAPASQRRALSSMRQLFLYAQRQRIIIQSPAKQIEPPDVPRSLPKVPNVAQASAMLDKLMGDNTPVGLRDRAALELLYGAGLRASELCGLRFDDIDLPLGLVRPRGKGAKDRVVPMGDAAAQAVKSYLVGGRPQLLRKDANKKYDGVFLGNRGQPLTRMGLFALVKRRAKEAGLDHSVSPHTLRHAFATHLVHGGADLRAVQEMLGHVSIATTEIYTHVGNVALQRTVDLHHPLARDLRAQKNSNKETRT